MEIMPNAQEIEFKEAFVKRYSSLTNFEEFKQYSLSFLRKGIRVNTLKINVSDLKKRLSADWILKQVPWCKQGFWIEHKGTKNDEGELEKRRDIGNLAEHVLGYIYVQEPASMIPPIILDPKPGETVLDMCAAPGSKTTQIAQYMENNGTIIANDLDASRLAALGINLQRCGVTNCIKTMMKGHRFGKLLENGLSEKSKLLPISESTTKTTYSEGRGKPHPGMPDNETSFCSDEAGSNLRSKDFSLSQEKGIFDKILVDAPCSGTGTIRKSLKTIRMWNPNMIKRISAIQKQLVKTAFPLLKKGGTMVYSTCTLEPEEDEEVIDYILNEFENAKVEKIELAGLKQSDAVTEFEGKKYSDEVKKCLRIWPQDNDSEGFFVGKIRKV
ncbi:SAM-dependent methyltransferase [Nanoarchaeota archaeon]